MPLQGTPVIQPTTTGVTCETQNVIPEEISFDDDCPVLPKMKLHVVNRGVCATLEKTIRNSAGQPIDLTNCLSCLLPPAAVLPLPEVSASSESASTSQSQSASASASSSASESLSESESVSVANDLCAVKVNIREMSNFCSNDKIYRLTGTIQSVTGGIVRVELPDEVVNCPGVYMMEWGIFDDNGKLVLTNKSTLWIETGLFGIAKTKADNMGPPSLSEIRLSIRDHAAENLLLDDVEFDSVEIGLSVVRPVREWNERPPPLRPLYSTKTFPFKEGWLWGIQAYLSDLAAHSYRRNRLRTDAAGVTIDDKNKEDEYLRYSKLMQDKFYQWLKMKKVEINVSLCVGHVGSTYGGMGGL